MFSISFRCQRFSNNLIGNNFFLALIVRNELLENNYKFASKLKGVRKSMWRSVLMAHAQVGNEYEDDNNAVRGM